MNRVSVTCPGEGEAPDPGTFSVMPTVIRSGSFRPFALARLATGTPSALAICESVSPLRTTYVRGGCFGVALPGAAGLAVDSAPCRHRQRLTDLDHVRIAEAVGSGQGLRCNTVLSRNRA